MLLALDIGNTNITCGIFEGKELIGQFRITTKIARTSDEYAIVFWSMIRAQKLDPDQVDAVIIGSVVPDIMHSLGSAFIKYFNITPMVVSAGIKTGIKIKTENPKQVGADRIIDAVAAYEIYGGPCIVVDYGTATTFDIVGANGTFEGAVIAPGIRTSADALTSQAAMLPSFQIKKPDTIIAKETISSMQAGIVYGQLGQLEYIVKKIRQESGYTDAKVVCTGGLGSLMSKNTDVIDIYDPQLTLKGLQIIYEKNTKKK